MVAENALGILSKTYENVKHSLAAEFDLLKADRNRVWSIMKAAISDPISVFKVVLAWYLRVLQTALYLVAISIVAALAAGVVAVLKPKQPPPFLSLNNDELVFF
jgi:acyl-CoA reductase-like NAD-dependent aldehyde dehydrogenase